jgi:hypothetical protein
MARSPMWEPMHGAAAMAAPATRRLARCVRIGPLAAVLALSLTLAACDKCGDFFWQTRPGACKAGPAPT